MSLDPTQPKPGDRVLIEAEAYESEVGQIRLRPMLTDPTWITGSHRAGAVRWRPDGPDRDGLTEAYGEDAVNLRRAIAEIERERDAAQKIVDGIHLAIHGNDALRHGPLGQGCPDLVIEVQELVRERDPARMIMDLVGERDGLAAELAEARMWARHGYEIGQRSCTWTDDGIAPAWLTDGHDPAALQGPDPHAGCEQALTEAQAKRDEAERHLADAKAENAVLRRERDAARITIRLMEPDRTDLRRLRAEVQQVHVELGNMAMFGGSPSVLTARADKLAVRLRAALDAAAATTPPQTPQPPHDPAPGMVCLEIEVTPHNMGANGHHWLKGTMPVVDAAAELQNLATRMLQDWMYPLVALNPDVPPEGPASPPQALLSDPAPTALVVPGTKAQGRFEAADDWTHPRGWPYPVRRRGDLWAWGCPQCGDRSNGWTTEAYAEAAYERHLTDIHGQVAQGTPDGPGDAQGNVGRTPMVYRAGGER